MDGKRSSPHGRKNQRRIDNQIKVNGHRIETGEVESIINQIPGVKNSAVIPYKNDGKVMRALLNIVENILHTKRRQEIVF